MRFYEKHRIIYFYLNYFRNGSGSISRKEIKQAFRDLDIRASEDEIDVVINQMDTDSKIFCLFIFLTAYF